MKMPKGLSRQIILYMSVVVVGVLLLSILGSYAFYALLMIYAPSSISFDGWIPSTAEWAWIALSSAAALIFAAVVAIKLARRILAPLISVAESLREVAQGNLDTRAVSTDRALIEAVQLVDDFNAMAQRLQRMSEEQRFWNAAIAHELRTPVTILQGRLQGLVDGVFTPDAQQFRSLLKQVEGLARLIEDLRLVGSADSGHLRLQCREVNLAGEIKELVQLFSAELQASGLVVELDLQDGPVACDFQRIRQAVMALLDNARRYAQPGALRIRLQRESDRCTLEVEDSGPGIAPADAEHVFDAFQRGLHAAEVTSAGSGLGLAVVRAIAQAHGGSVSYRPSPCGGSVFQLQWPL